MLVINLTKNNDNFLVKTAKVYYLSKVSVG